MREIEEECYLRIEPLSCEWNKKTARLSVAIVTFPLFLFFFSCLFALLSSSSSFFSSSFFTYVYYSLQVGQVSETFSLTSPLLHLVPIVRRACNQDLPIQTSYAEKSN